MWITIYQQFTQTWTIPKIKLIKKNKNKSLKTIM